MKAVMKYLKHADSKQTIQFEITNVYFEKNWVYLKFFDFLFKT